MYPRPSVHPPPMPGRMPRDELEVVQKVTATVRGWSYCIPVDSPVDGGNVRGLGGSDDTWVIPYLGERDVGVPRRPGGLPHENIDTSFMIKL